jgi:hypothetical protein
VLTQLAAAEHGTLQVQPQAIRQPTRDSPMMMWSLSARRAGSRTDSIGRLGTDWTNFSVQLSASANWRWNWNQPATQEQMHQVLAAPTRLEIRGEFRTGDDTAGWTTFS